MLAPRLITAPVRLLMLLARPHKLLKRLLWLLPVLLILLLVLTPLWMIADDEDDDEAAVAAAVMMACGQAGPDGDAGQIPPFADSSVSPAVLPTPRGDLPSPATLDEVAELADPAELVRLANLTSLSDITGISSSGPTARAAIGYTDRQPATVGTMDMERVLAALRTIESGTPQGNYRAFNEHGGAGGAYQFLPGTWRGMGGTGSARDAPPAEQDMRARRYLAELTTANSGPLSLSAGLSWFLGPGGVKPFMALPWDHPGWNPARDGEGSSARLYRARFSLAYLALSLQGGDTATTDGAVAPSAPGSADIATAEMDLADRFAAYLFAAGIDPEDVDPDDIDPDDINCDLGDRSDDPDQASLAGADPSSGSGAVGADGYSFPVDRRSFDNPDTRWWFLKPHHNGQPASDLPVTQGTPVYAMVDGVVVQRNPGGLCGYGVVYEGDDGGRYTYCHASMVPDHIRSGRRVQAGEQVMVSGGALSEPYERGGSTTGDHLHVGIQVDGQRICPQDLFIAIGARSSVDLRDLLDLNSNCDRRSRQA